MMRDSCKLYAQWGGRSYWYYTHLILVYTRTICKRKTLMVWVDYGNGLYQVSFNVFDPPVDSGLLAILHRK